MSRILALLTAAFALGACCTVQVPSSDDNPGQVSLWYSVQADGSDAQQVPDAGATITTSVNGPLQVWALATDGGGVQKVRAWLSGQKQCSSDGGISIVNIQNAEAINMAPPNVGVGDDTQSPRTACLDVGPHLSCPGTLNNLNGKIRGRCWDFHGNIGNSPVLTVKIN